MNNNELISENLVRNKSLAPLTWFNVGGNSKYYFQPKSVEELIKFLKEKKIKTLNGLDMFLYQGQKSFYLWNKINPEIDDKLISLLISKLK